MYKITVDGYTYNNLCEACRAYDVNYLTAYCRYKKGMDIEAVLSRQSRSYVISKDHLGNVFPSIKAMCKAYNINIRTFHWRINHGWDMEKCLTQPVDISKHNKTRPSYSKISNN